MDKNKTLELQYLMRYYHIDHIPLFHNGTYCGQLTQELKYTDTYHAPCKFTSHEYAVECACNEIDDIVDVVKHWNAPTKVKVIYHHSTRGEVVCKDGYRYIGFIEKEEEVEYEGTFDKVCERLEKANNRLRYCNGCWYKFKDEDMRKKYRYWSSLIPSSRSFEMYYPGNTVVD